MRHLFFLIIASLLSCVQKETPPLSSCNQKVEYGKIPEIQKVLDEFEASYYNIRRPFRLLFYYAKSKSDPQYSYIVNRYHWLDSNNVQMVFFTHEKSLFKCSGEPICNFPIRTVQPEEYYPCNQTLDNLELSEPIFDTTYPQF